MTRSSSSQESQALRERLTTGATALGLPLTASQLNALLAYLDQLVRWNKTFNLTAIREPAEMVDRHLLDSVAMLPLINRLFSQCSIHVMDVGTGAGLPGIPIAIARPGGSLTLVETNGKKAAFLRQCQIELSLSSVQICQSRIETLTPEQLELGKPDLIIARAFRGISEYLELIAPFVSDETVVLAMKGPALNDELDQMAQKIEANRVSEQLLSFLASHQMSTEVLEFANSQVTRQVAIFSSPSHSAIRPSAVSFQE